jgi:uncharacterized repeat protein (TIGR01451 family)
VISFVKPRSVDGNRISSGGRVVFPGPRVPGGAGIRKRCVVAIVAWSLAMLTWLAWPSTVHGSRLDSPLDPWLSSSRTLTAGQPSTPRSLAKIDPALLKEVLEGAPEDRVRFIVELAEQRRLTAFAGESDRLGRRQQVVTELQATARRSQAGLLAFLQDRQADGRVTGLRSFWIFNGLAMTADADTLLALAARPEVRLIRQDRWQIRLDPSPEPEELREDDIDAGWNIARIRADLAWQALGVDGAGVTVAIMDTGVDWQHPALQSQYRGYKPGGLSIHEGNWYCTTNEGYLYPVDGHGHGTHVAGTAVGSRDGAGRPIGVAPGARWIAVKALNDAGYGYDSWIHAAFEWLMAPAGDPALAPDVVNGSWGGRYGDVETFREDIRALRAAGIVPIFAAGNNGPVESTVGNPASYPEAVAVGATDDLDGVARFSSRGPSPWGEVKPEISAPGVEIYSSLPGGTYGMAQGTSMAAPHVTGLVALLLQADPTLTIDAMEALITSTALPLGDQVPNNDTGWGRIDAYQAVAVALEAGFVRGQVVGLPQLQGVPGAQVTVYDDLNTRRGVVDTDAGGHYWLALPDGTYRFNVQAFGFEPKMMPGVAVHASYTATLDVQLEPLPQGILSGQIREAGTDKPVAAQIRVVGTPVSTTSDPSTGQYMLDLPLGTYAVEISSNGHRRYTAPGVEILAGETRVLDVALVPAPTIVFVDSGWWYYGSEARYLTQALDDNDYVYDTWQVRDLSIDRPDLNDLMPYEVTIWSSPLDAPGLIGAGDTISGYLAAGGNLFLTGQDVGFWESGASGATYHEYYSRFLKAQLLSDDAGRGDVIGSPGEILHDLVLPVNGPESAQNQTTPDSIALSDPGSAELIADYEADGGAGLRASGCQSYRAVYLAAGLEGLGDRSSRATLMDRALAWLAAPDPERDVGLYPASQDRIRFAAQYVTYTVELRNNGTYSARFSLELSPSAWATSIWDSAFSKEIVLSDRLDPCQTQTLGVKILVPPGTAWDVSDTVTLTARSLADPANTAQARFTTKTPAPILLVDDHRWHDASDIYRAALGDNHLPYDVWVTNPSASTAEVNRPSLPVLQCYPLVIWYTVSDWWSTLVPVEEARLAQYLEQGGRLLLSSQDYLETSEFTEFARDYLGVASYTEGMTVTSVMGAIGDPIGEGLAQTDLYYRFQNRSDALRPTTAARPAFWGQHGQPVALTVERPPWKTAFFAFPLETLPGDKLAEVMGRAVGWLSPLADSRLAVDRSAASEGEQLVYTLSIRNTGPAPLSDVSVSNAVPLSTTYVAGSLEGPAEYSAALDRFTWHGAVDTGQTIIIRYRLQLDSPMPDGVTLQNVAYLSDESGLALGRAATSRVNAPDLSASTLRVSREKATPGRVLTYTLVLQNSGPSVAQAHLVDPIPLHTVYRPGSAWASSGLVTRTVEGVVWDGLIEPGDTIDIHFSVVLDASSAAGFVLNRAVVGDGWNAQYPMETYTWVNAQAFLPTILEQVERRD